jgi:hypothetical protein
MGKFLTDVDLNQNELQYAVIQNLNTDPIVSTTGQIYYNANISKLRLKTSTGWVTISTGTITIPTLQDVVNSGNSISNFGGIGNADILSVNFTNNRSLYLNNSSSPTIKIIDNLNASHYVIIDIDTINLNGTSYNWSTIVSGGTQDLQQVLTNGNSALDKQIILRNGSVINPTSQSVWNALGIGVETGNKQSYLPAGELALIDTSVGGTIQLNATDKSLRIQDGTIRTDLLNGTDRVYQLPNADGTIALTSDITTPTLQQVTDAGNETANPLIVTDNTENETQLTDRGIRFYDLDESGDTYLKFINTTAAAQEIEIRGLGGTMALLSDITTPTLQEVLDNNHDLVDNNNFQGTDAGVNNTGTNVNALGEFAASSNTGIAINALGKGAGVDNTGNSVNALGQETAFENIGNDVNALGFRAGVNNAFNNVNLFGETAQADENGQTVLSKDGTIMARISTTDLTATRKYNLPDDSGTLALTSDIPAAGVTSVGLTMPSAFTVTNSPITSSGDIAVTGVGLVSQYIRGDGTLANFPNSTGGGSSVNYYLNGSVSQGTFGGDTYYQMSKTPILGAGTNFTRTNGAGNGYIASFITDVADPSQLNIPGGNWNVEFYFNASSGGGSPSFYAELYKVSATNVFTLIASDSANPEGITNGTTVDQYFTSIPVPQTTLLATDRLAIRIFVNTGGRTITLHTENGNLSEVLTTFTTGLTALNGLTAQVQNLAVGTTGTDFAINSNTATHTFNLPTASAANRGALSSADWTIFNNKQNNLKTFNRTQGVYYFEEFMGNQAGGLGASYSTVITLSSGNATARTVATTNRTNQQGIIQPQTGTGATNFAGYNYGGLGTNGTLYIGSGSISLETYVTVETLSNATERFHTIFGYYNGSNFSNTANGIFFSYDEAGTMFFEFGAAATPNWKCYTRGGATVTRTNTSIPVVAGQWYKLRIDVNAAGNSVTFYIDGTLVATHTTNIPATTTGMLITSLINKTAGTTARSLLTDYFMYEEIFTNPR